MTYTIEAEPFGGIEVTESGRSRRLSVRIYPNGRIRVSAPLQTPREVVIEFINKFGAKIKAALAKTGASDGCEAGAKLIIPGIKFKTSQRDLEFEMARTLEHDWEARISYDKIKIYYTEGADLASDKFQAYVRKVIDSALKNEATHYLPRRTEELAAQQGLKYDHVALRNMTTQWGSCSSNGRICLNIQLMRLPKDLRDLVIMHELTHTLHMDHSKAFYADLDRFLNGRMDELNKRLKKRSTSY